MKNFKTTLKEETNLIMNRIKKNSISLALTQSNEGMVISEEMEIPHVLKLLNDLKNKK
ncbi:hypothetical protein NEPAR06_1658 [Nematocida parisii]|uniref:Uncharacterized protein n=1 Tax=Nematocida parisii (strain ERTm3) TaxID=935791 RepID=I3EKI3_NEMP3|nr:uncharacterized protein NEPG_00733 [Nematocida parisii ERTm1]EIJ89730.1 hypothetical protein NEQG_00500 [Nematocida parisii ERTm3]KAI5129705.1 hypothetical protein NEPAR08_1687 [Nematocida parisii]EIJ94067.1 hypothetical protein NEPG_00733 [Nematocida parisii ERTm1]KAI5129735.1 hypothetical protein NEPAR03_1770 [Nematocida parisii]KAI5142797.1 hypothetical protein NEPAR04_1619 [Nematocida parisii]|eukprot:XP_013058563.1 hypothetical protein NEPG_00733 [Nematocida parisii ERTm1]